MGIQCPHCHAKGKSSDNRPTIIWKGFFYRKNDSQMVRRYYCRNCNRGFSNATLGPCYRQKKRNKNALIREHFARGMSQRGSAWVVKVNRKTVARKLKFLAQLGLLELEKENQNSPPAQHIQFDDLETCEHSKLKPVSVTMVVEFKTRRIIGFEVSRMPAKGPLAQKSKGKYGFRPDERPQARDKLFTRVQPFVHPNAIISSDKNPHYPPAVRKHFPNAVHKVTKGRRGCVAGQGELKKGGFDPLFSLNHTYAMLRANISRLIRRTWNISKKMECLQDHLYIYAAYHNKILKLRK